MSEKCYTVQGKDHCVCLVHPSDRFFAEDFVDPKDTHDGRRASRIAAKHLEGVRKTLCGMPVLEMLPKDTPTQPWIIPEVPLLDIKTLMLCPTCARMQAK